MPVQKELVKIQVKFTILTPDQLKQIEFGLNKDKAAGGVTDSWKITFTLLTRSKKAEEFVKIADAEVDADLKDAPLAEETSRKGVNKPQSDHLTINVATAAERLKAGKIQQPTFDRTLKRTLPARNAASAGRKVSCFWGVRSARNAVFCGIQGHTTCTAGRHRRPRSGFGTACERGRCE